MTMSTLQTIDLDALRSSAERRILLLDGALIKDLGAQVRALDIFAQRRWVYEDTEYAGRQEHGPLLVDCTAGSALLPHFIDVWSQQHGGVVMGGQQPLETWTAHWRQLRHALLPNGQLSLFRAHDPRRLRGLLAILQPDERNELLGPADWLAWCEDTGSEHTWYRHTRNEECEPTIQTCPWRLSSAHLDALSAADSKALLEWHTRRLQAEVPALASLTPEAAAQQVRILMADGRALGFMDGDDLARYLDLLFQHNKRCCAPGPLRDLIRRTDLTACQRLDRARHLIKQETAA